MANSYHRFAPQLDYQEKQEGDILKMFFKTVFNS